MLAKICCGRCVATLTGVSQRPQRLEPSGAENGNCEPETKNSGDGVADETEGGEAEEHRPLFGLHNQR